MEGTAVSPVSVFQCEPMVEAVRGHLVVSKSEVSGSMWDGVTEFLVTTCI